MPSLHTENKLVPVVRNILLPSVHKVFMRRVTSKQDMDPGISKEYLVNDSFQSDRDEETEPTTTVNVGTRALIEEHIGVPTSASSINSASLRGETEGKILLDTDKRRLVNKSGELKVLAKNVPRKTRLYLADIFTTMIDLRWKWVIFIFISSYIISWVVFGFIWWLIAYVRGSTICIEKVYKAQLFKFSVRSSHP